jgi:putative peptide zinc metalloprotease protein
MRFDGYYLLADALEIPNLYSQGARWVKDAAGRIFLGKRFQRSRESGMRGLIVRSYGVAALVWRVVVCVSLSIAAAALFHGAGIVLALSGVALWLWRPAWSLAAELARPDLHRLFRLARFATVAGALAGLLAWLAWLPWPLARTAAGIVQHTDLAVVRAGSPGFIRDVRVRDGQCVKCGELLVQLANDDLETEFRDLQLALEISTARHQMYLQRNEVPRAQVELQERLALEKQLVEKTRQRDALSVRAPRRGRVMVRDPEALTGTYLEEGDEILAIGDAANKELRASVAEADAQHFAARLGNGVEFRLRGRPAGSGRLLRLTPSASTELVHPALGAQFGGPLAVVSRRPESDGAVHFTLAKPHFAATVCLAAEAARDVHAGELAIVSIATYDRPVGQVVYRGLAAWVRQKFDASVPAGN